MLTFPGEECQGRSFLWQGYFIVLICPFCRKEPPHPRERERGLDRRCAAERADEDNKIALINTQAF